MLFVDQLITEANEPVQNLKYLFDNHQNNWLDCVIKHKYHNNEHKLLPQQTHEKVDDFETSEKKKSFFM